jgi:hypothetical protein
MAAHKVERAGPALAHAISYAACFVPVTRDRRALFVIGATHFVIDRYRLAKYVCWAKNQLVPAVERYPFDETTPTGYPPKPHGLEVPLMIAADNAIHLAINGWALRRWPSWW